MTILYNKYIVNIFIVYYSPCRIVGQGDTRDCQTVLNSDDTQRQEKGTIDLSMRTLLASNFGSPCATLFITVLFLPQLTEVPQYQGVIKYQAAADEAETVLIHISSLFWFYTPCHSLSQLLS